MLPTCMSNAKPSSLGSSPLLPLLLRVSVAVTPMTMLAGCASADDGADGASTTDELRDEDLPVPHVSATCKSARATFTLTRKRLDSNQQSAERPVRYAIGNITLDGVSYPGTFSDERSPLGWNLRAEFWNGIPLVGSRYLTDSRMHAEKPRGPDNRGTGWGGPPLSFNERVQCEVVATANPSFRERFERAYESRVTGIAAQTPIGALVQVTSPKESSIPANLVPSFRTTGALSVFEFEGERVYVRTRPYAVFYDASGAPFTRGTWFSQKTEGVSFSPEEWASFPRSLWVWGLD